MKEMNLIAEYGLHSGGGAATPVMEADAELTPRAEAKAANQLPKAEQLNGFEKDLEEHDPGNQPA